MAVVRTAPRPPLPLGITSSDDTHLDFVLVVLAGFHTPERRLAWLAAWLPKTAGLLASRVDWERLTVEGPS